MCAYMNIKKKLSASKLALHRTSANFAEFRISVAVIMHDVPWHFLCSTYSLGTISHYQREEIQKGKKFQINPVSPRN